MRIVGCYLARTQRQEHLWYFPMMNDQPLPAATPGADGAARATGTRSEPSLARRHSRALYRPVPPVECDDDGYPFRDGAPVESTLHEELRTYASSALKARYAARDDVFVAAELGLFFERGNRKALLAPDALVSFGVNAEHRLSYKAWEEGAIPDFVLELLSARTWRRDVVVKPPLYEAIGVHEYWIFDPIGKLADPIVGRRLDAAGVYRPVQEQSAGGYRSEVLGLDLLLHGDGFRFRDPKTGEILSDHVEAVAQRRAAERARDEETAARRAAEARIAQLEKRLRQR
ncbi:MAG: Uma2 family endonuclease [Gammaproteobacteria bacterium]|nr:Uma2 family endonuclease [Gammaproteobacteria bacterium]